MSSSTKEKEIIKSVRRLYRDEAWAERLFDSLAERKNNPAATTIDRLMRLLSLTLSEATAAAKELQGTGCGTYIVGRKGNASRFAWDYSAISLGLAATGRADTIVGMTEEGSERGEEAPSRTPPLQLTIQQAKEALARTYGITPDQIEITIKG